MAEIDVRVPPCDDGRWRYLVPPGAAAAGQWTGFGLGHLEPGEELAVPGPGLEAVVVPLRGGVCVAGAGGLIELAGREDVWDGPTDVAYLPPASAAGAWRLAARQGAADVAIGLAPAQTPSHGQALHVPAAAVSKEQRGQGPTRREVRHLYEADRPAERLLVVEVITPAGHWSSFPPHRHDGPGGLEEFYYCEVRPKSRHAYLHVFQEGPGRTPFDMPVCARHGDLVLVREGYHTAACPPGSTLYYLNVMAGPQRAWTPEFHPAYRDLVIGWEGAPIAKAAGDP